MLLCTTEGKIIRCKYKTLLRSEGKCFLAEKLIFNVLTPSLSPVAEAGLQIDANTATVRTIILN